ncbi:PREDICTED: spermatogenesis-associated protein 2-like protein [Nanorana parkeri]|uniref:spermatogenesis-associated protein 2-like protein n=1 Tax=Nanorana parkeri TaxID=125878 RepID=UPI0008547F28|nr:PREDICTED: spermatogenesis-associated protein 2-like protein [Nanorana parkeri]
MGRIPDLGEQLHHLFALPTFSSLRMGGGGVTSYHCFPTPRIYVDLGVFFSRLKVTDESRQRMSVDSLLAQYRSWLLSISPQGDRASCTNAKLIDKVRGSILEEPDLHHAFHNDVFSLVASGLQDQSDLLSTLNRMADAFQTLELAALHLYFTPWRKEFHTIKTYSGHYVHILEPALSQDGIFLALGKLGYEPQEGGTCLCLQVLPSEHALSMAALGFLAAQLECRILTDIVQCSGPASVNGADLIQERKTWRGEAACMERLQKLIQEADQVPKSPPTLEACKSGAFNGDSELYRPKFCDLCHETWDQHRNGKCRERTETQDLLPRGEDASHGLRKQVEFDMHDCVYADNSLEQCCAECRLFHSSSCPVLPKCKNLGHPVTQLTPLKKREAVMEEEGKKYQLHICLQPGQLPHYRCSECRELHYINCKGLEQCRSKKHSAKMIMLEKDQQLWLRRSLMDLTQLCIDRAVDRGSEV